jgi:hypothetical protein
MQSLGINQPLLLQAATIGPHHPNIVEVITFLLLVHEISTKLVAS